MKTGYKNFEKYWKNWNVLQTPKINFETLEKNGWSIMDVNVAAPETIAMKDGVTIRVTYLLTGGVQKITVKKDQNIIYNQLFSFILKPTIEEINKIICLSIDDDTCNLSQNKKYIEVV